MGLVMVDKPHPLRGHSIEMGSLDFILPIATQVPAPQVIGQDKDEIGSAGLRVLGRTALAIHAGHQQRTAPPPQPDKISSSHLI